MKVTDRTAAITLYLLLALFALGALALFLTAPPEKSWSLITATPGATLLVSTLSALGVVSFGIAALLLRRPPRSALALKILALSLPVVAFGWNLVAPVFWLLPVFFVWRSASAS
jgi:hypothetical protein